MRKLTLKELETNKETLLHIQLVREFLVRIIGALSKRAEVHDESKLELPEVEVFTKYTPLLAKTTYGSEEYNMFLKEMKEGALDHHYAVNRHHPEHFTDGVSGMNLVDLVEMFCDWKAATLRHDDGDISKSIEHSKERFELSDQLVRIFHNTVRDLGW
jgi:hypothetical protein